MPFLVGWIIFNLAVAYFAPLVISYLGHFSFPSELYPYEFIPKFIRSFANFDGIHYIKIARIGYVEFTQAFFPLYPLLMKGIGSVIGNNYLVAGLLISNLSFILGLHMFQKYLHELKLNKQNVLWTIIFLLTFPTSFFFNAVYTEGLFFLLLVSTFYFLEKKSFASAALTAFFASLTKFIGVVLIVPIVIHYVMNYKIGGPRRGAPMRGGFFEHMGLARSRIYFVVLILAPLLGLATYMFFLWKSVGDPLAFLHAQTVFERSTSFILLPQVYVRYLKIFLTAQHNFQYFISVVEFTLYSLILALTLLDLRKLLTHNSSPITHNRSCLALNIFSLLNLLIPPLTGTLLSTPRFALMSLSAFIFLGQWNNRTIKTVIAILFAVLHAVLLAYFIQGYFVS